MILHLRDRKIEMSNHWTALFGNDPNVKISHGDIFDDGEHMRVDAIVSPANGFGFMDGGIDYVYSEFFGWDMQMDLQELLWQEHNGELLVGQAVVIDIRNTNDATPIPYLISAPTMRVPMDVSDTVNAYLAFVAALRVAEKHPEINSILCPGLAIGVGKMAPKICAAQMHAAWKRYNNPKAFDVLGDAYHDHHDLLQGV